MGGRMTLEWRQVDVPFAQGLDTKSDPLQIPVGKLSDLSNGRILKTGQVTKRHGYTSLTNNYWYPSAEVYHATTFEDQLLIVNSPYRMTQSYSSANNTWNNVGFHFTTDLTVNTVSSPQTKNYSNPDVASAGGVDAYVHLDSSGALYLNLIDSVTGAPVYTESVVSPHADEPKIVVAGGTFLVFYANTLDDKLYYFSATTAGVVGVSAVVYSDGSTLTASNHKYDVTVLSTGHVMLVRGVPSGHIFVGATLFSVSSGVLTQVANRSDDLGAGVTLSNVCAIENTSSPGTTAELYTTVESGNAVLHARSFGALLSSPVESTLLSFGAVANNNSRHLCACSLNGQYLYVFVELEDTASGTESVRTVYVRTQLAAGGAQLLRSTTYGIRLSGKPMLCAATSSANALVAVPAIVNRPNPSYPNSIQSFNAILAIDDTYDSTLRVVAKSGQGLVSSGRSAHNVTESVSLGGGRYLTTFAQMAQQNGTSALTGVVACRVDFSSRAAFRNASINGELFTGGGCPHTCDGKSIVEAGFHLYPEVFHVASVTGTSVPIGTYQYCFTYQWTDANGVVHESAPSVPVTVNVTGAATNIEIKVMTLPITEKTGVRVVGWRTAALGFDFTFYRFTSASAPTANDKTSNTVNITDNGQWSVSNEFLYTTGGRLANSFVPSLINPVVWKNRLWAIGPDGRTLWYSKLSEAGYPTEWSDTQQARLDDRFGKITALAAMDSALIIFTATAVYMLAGEGPDNTGANNDYGFPNLVTTDVGCANQDSIVTTPNGLMFQSGKGIYLLNRSFQAQYLGAPAEAYNSKTVSAATLVQDANEVRFTLSDGPVLVYNYYFDQWSTFDIQNKLGGGTWQGGHYTWDAGAVHVENDNYDDDGAATTLRLATGWLPLSGMQGYQRVRDALLLARPNGTVGHTVSSYLSYDYDETAWGTPAVFDSDALRKTDVTIAGPNNMLDPSWVLTGMASATADTLTADVTAGSHLATQTLAGMTAGVSTTVSVEIHAITAAYAMVRLGSSYAEIDTLGWTVADSSGFSSMTITNIGFNWRRFTGTATPSASTVALGPSSSLPGAGSASFRNLSITQTAAAASTEQMQIWVGKPRCEALRIKLEVTPKTGSEASNPCTLSGLTLTVGAKRGHYKVQPNRRVSA